MSAVGRGRCTEPLFACSSRFCPYHGERNRKVFTPRVVYSAPEQAAPASSGHLGVVPLAPTRSRAPGRGASFALGLAAVAAAVLMSLGVVQLVHLLGGGR